MSMILEDRSKNGSNTARQSDTGSNFVKDLFSDYIQYTNLDDPKYHKHKKHRIAVGSFWLITVICCGILCFVFTHKLWTRWSQSSLVIMNADKLVPIHEIPFPAVTVCLETKSMASKYNFTENYHLYNNSKTRAEMSEKDRAIFEDLTLVCDNHLNSAIGRNFSDSMSCLSNLMTVAPETNEAFFVCKWKYAVTDSCSTLFSPVLTEEGICFTFNMLGSDEIFKKENLQNEHLYVDHKDKPEAWTLESGYTTTKKDTYPRRATGYGANMGLVFLVTQNKDDLDYLCKGPVQGSKVHLHNPAEFPRMTHQYFRTANNKESVVTVQPRMMTTSEALRSYPPERRQCYFAEERYLHYFKVYTQSNCEFECLTNHTYAKCGCVHIGMPRGPDMKVCNTGKVECMNKARNNFMEQQLDAVLQQKENCNCLPSCTSIEYVTEISQADYDFKSLYNSYRIGAEEGINQNLLMSRIKLFFKSSQFIASQRREMYGAIDFLADCGGIFGLFLGISLLGLVKIIYFVGARIYNVFLRRDKRNDSDHYETVTDNSIGIN